MKNSIRLFEVPFIHTGVKFNIEELTARIEKFIYEIKILIPKIEYLSCDLDYELSFDKDHIWLVIFLFKQSQFVLPMFDELSLSQAKLEIIDELKMLPMNINLFALKTFSVESEDGHSKDEHDEKIKQLMKKKQKETLKFLLEDEDIKLGFPEMAPYIIDNAVRLIQFKIEYIHCDYFKIKLLSDSLAEFRRNKTSYLKIGNKIFDDSFFYNCAGALRSKPKKLMTSEAYCFRDSVTNDILMYQII